MPIEKKESIHWLENLSQSTVLRNLTAVLCILSWRVFWMTMIHRIEPNAAPEVAFTELELYLLDKLMPDKNLERGDTVSRWGRLIFHVRMWMRSGHI